jgi:hypothetical protein
MINPGLLGQENGKALITQIQLGGEREEEETSFKGDGPAQNVIPLQCDINMK